MLATKTAEESRDRIARGRIVVTGAAGLVGQNLIARLASSGWEIVALDKHAHNVGILKKFHPDLRVVLCDLAEPGPWQEEFAGCTHLVSAHAQIGGSSSDIYRRNNIIATERMLDASLKYGIGYAVNISSSVVNSMAVDDYTETKKAQEALVAASGIRQVILRPTLMFGWFDRKHIGWLARFMQRVPVFPVPGDGQALRQPLYAGDFCRVITSSLENGIEGAYNITGQQRVTYLQLMQMVKKAAGARARIVKIPYRLFWAMLKAYSLVDNDPPFTTTQLEALVTPDIFEVIDWPRIFGITATPLDEALNATFRDPRYSQVALEFLDGARHFATQSYAF